MSSRSDNPLLVETLASTETDTPTRFCASSRPAWRGPPRTSSAPIQAYARRYREFVELVAPPLVVPGGERVKNDPHLVEQVQEAIHGGAICRHSYVVAIGGGALLDMVGYAAATAHRGVRLVRIPTTVLAQSDSGVGVKNGINAFGKKNFLGTFAPPAAVINDTTFLETLLGPRMAQRPGRSDQGRLAQGSHAPSKRSRRSPRRWPGAIWPPCGGSIYRSAQLHLQHIATSGDAFELGSSRPLDMGHWAAHKLESLSGYRLLHGEAVAIGLALDATYAHADRPACRA